MSNIAVVILAAGAASRMGQPKQFMSMGGMTLLDRAISEASRSELSPIIVVLGAHQPAQALPATAIAEQNPQWQEGMGTSLRAGVRRAVTESPDIDAVAIMLCDQARITSNHLNELRRAFESSDKPIVAASYSHTLGPPCIFGKAHFQQLLNVKPEHGAKAILLQAGNDVLTIECPEASLDIDTPADYENARRNITS